MRSLPVGDAPGERRREYADGADNICLLAAFADQIYANRLGCQTRAVFAYDERLRLLPAYLQQLEMESNGKRGGKSTRRLARRLARQSRTCLASPQSRL